MGKLHSIFYLTRKKISYIIKREVKIMTCEWRPAPKIKKPKK